jgi:hypothetical protein
MFSERLCGILQIPRPQQRCQLIVQRSTCSLLFFFQYNVDLWCGKAIWLPSWIEEVLNISHLLP